MFWRIIFSIYLVFISTLKGYTQEFKEYTNGLIYDDTTIKELRFIVDSLNLKYRKCDPWKDYYSCKQAICNTITLDTGNIKAAKLDIEHNISFENFSKKYPFAEIQKGLLTTKNKSENYYHERQVEFSTLEIGDNYGHSITSKDTSLFDKNLKGQWVLQYSSNEGSDNLKAFYFTNNFESIKLPEKYERMIQYADCMIDTNSSIFFKNAAYNHRKQFGMESEIDTSSKTPLLNKFSEYINKKTFKPDKKDYKIDSLYQEAYDNWDEKKDSIIDYVAATQEFKTLLHNAILEAISIGNTNEELEYLSEKYDTKEHTLQLKRERIVVGGCSQDAGPRIHALEIARLSAETVNWDIFLRAHLDIMNDRFSRMSDGNYAWAKRKTYIKELENLDFDVTTLILGICFRIENPSGNHYFGYIGRLGRAISESNNTDEFEKQMIKAISDQKLDNFNRLIFYYLYKNYTYFTHDSVRKKRNILALKAAVKTLPPNFSSKIKISEEDFPE